MQTILVTGGAGYIGSHTVIELLEAGQQVVVADNLSNASLESVKRVQELTGQEVKFHQLDINDEAALSALFDQYSIDSVIHFAAMKAVGESVAKPLAYYQNNVSGTITLLRVMAAKNVRNFVFSSSATVYGIPDYVPLDEKHALSAVNPYGQTKLMVENILRDLSHADAEWNIVLLRYFNPIGAHESGRIGEDPNDIPNNLMPYVTQVAVGKLAELAVFGDDYDTPDGTGVRDYIHVVDLAKGHVKALDKINEKCGLKTYNLGTGNGYSVLDIVNTFKEVTGVDVAYKIAPRRPGDVGTCYADPAFASIDLGWRAEKDLADMLTDAWRWQSENPEGYGS